MRWSWAFAAVAIATVPGRAAAQFDSGIPVGSKAPIVSIHDLDGKPVDLGQYIGKRPVLIEFWATWCALCKQLLPELGRVQKKYGDQVTMIGVNITVNDSKDRVRRYLEAHKPPYLPLFDDQGVGSRAYDAATTSYIVVIDKAGKVVYTGTGGEQDLVSAVGKAVGR
jgi:thiol-disulfide isomerase/thioredoxin